MPFPAETGILCFASIFVFPQIKAEELRVLFRWAKEQGILVCADMTKRKNGETAEDLAAALKYVDYLIPNDAEAMLLTGENTVEAAAEALLAAGAGTVVIKCGAKGCFVRHGGGAFWAPAVQGVDCVDTTGAGDSFVAGFLYGLANDLSLEECARKGNVCGARAVETIGAVTWTLS